MKICQLPPASYAKESPNNGIHRVVIAFDEALKGEHTSLETPDGADLVISHAGAAPDHIREKYPILSVCHGLNPTSMQGFALERQAFKVNKRVADDLMVAKDVIVPSQWVADILRRDAKLEPHVVHWGIDVGAWQNDQKHLGYVLWNKNREDLVCNPRPVMELGKRLPSIKFKTTFGQMTPNVEVIGNQPHERMINHVKRAGVYLATTKETGDIGSREALAAGVPVVGFAHGAVRDIVQTGVNGVLVEAGDYDALANAVKYCLEHREVLSHNARLLAQTYDWQYIYPRLRDIVNNLDFTLGLKPLYDISVIIPCYNYGKYLVSAVESVVKQTHAYNYEVIIVDDGSTDDTEGIAKLIMLERPFVKYVKQDNGGVAEARNRGIREAMGEFVVALDADDKLADGFLQKCLDTMRASPSVGIAYTRLQLLSGGVSEWLSLPFDYEGQISGQNQIPTCCMYRRADALRIGGYRSDMQPSEDADFFTRLLTYTGKSAVKASEEPLFIYNVHQGSLSDTYRITGKPDPFRQRGLPTWGDKRPFVAPPKPGAISNPVFAYDKPIIRVELIGDKHIQARLDDLDMQTMWQWSLREKAPLVFRFGEDTRIPSKLFAEIIEHGTYAPDKGQINEVVQMSCCGRVVSKGVVANMTEQDFIKCRCNTGKQGKITVVSPNAIMKPDGSGVIKYHVRHGEEKLIHRLDVATLPHVFMPVPNPTAGGNAAQFGVVGNVPPPMDNPQYIDPSLMMNGLPPEIMEQIRSNQPSEIRIQQGIMAAKHAAAPLLQTDPPKRTVYYDLRQCADFMGISYTRLNNLVKKAKLTPHQMQGKLRTWNMDRLRAELNLNE